MTSDEDLERPCMLDALHRQPLFDLSPVECTDTCILAARLARSRRSDYDVVFHVAVASLSPGDPVGNIFEIVMRQAVADSVLAGSLDLFAVIAGIDQLARRLLDLAASDQDFDPV